MDGVVVEADGARLTVRVSKPDGPPILLLHGGPGVPDSMQTTIAPLLADLRCLSFDQRGVGASMCTDGRYDLDAYLADIEAIREHLGVDRWHVLGHS
jgi:proline iminopeptidase